MARKAFSGNGLRNSRKSRCHTKEEKNKVHNVSLTLIPAEHGALMATSILNTPRAIDVSVLSSKIKPRSLA